MRRYLILVLLILFAAAVLRAQEKLVVISPHWEGVKIEVENAFRDYYARQFNKQIDIQWIDQGGTSDDVKYVESLFQKNPKTVGIDLFFGGGLDPYLRLKEKNLLQKYGIPDSLLRKIPAQCQGIPNYDNDYTWYGVVLASVGILCNKKALEFMRAPIPSRWKDLAGDRYYGWVGASDPRHSGSMHMMFEIIMQAQGWEKGWETVLGIMGNTVSVPASASQSAKDTSLGQTAVSLAIDSYGLAQVEVNGPENMTFVLPEGETVINPDCVGILKGAPNVEASRIFVNFLLSEECQKIFMYRRGSAGGPKEFSLNRLSILPSIYEGHEDIVPVNPYRLKGTLSFDFNLASKRWALLNDLVGVFAIDCADVLRKAYGAVLSGRCPDAEFYRLPLTEKDQDKLISKWKDQVFRNRTLNQYLNFSARKYKACARR